MKYFNNNYGYDDVKNILYINTNLIMCDLRGLTPKEKSKAIMNHFRLNMGQRINLSKHKKEIIEEIKKHKGCKLSEFSTL